MKVTCIQMSMLCGQPDANFEKVSRLIEAAMSEAPDVVVLPETWNTGFFPRENAESLCDNDGVRTKAQIGALAAKYHVNIVAGSVTNVRNGKVYNSAYIFDREGACVGAYDKTHLFSPMGEHKHCTPGNSLCRFILDGVPCGIIICYDVRFPELIRSMALQGMDMLFVVSQWPKARTFHLRSLTTARAIENQMFVVCCNSCGTAGKMVYGGNSAIIDPWGETLALAGEEEQLLSAECDFSTLQQIRDSINVFADRRPELYQF